MSLTSFNWFCYISGVTDGKENTGFFPPSECCKSTDLELWIVDDYLTLGIVSSLVYGAERRGRQCMYLAYSLYFPLCIIVGHFDQMIRLNMIKLQGGDQKSSLEKNLFSHQVSLVLQVKTNI